MPTKITADALKRIAEACGYEDYKRGGFGGQVLVEDEWVDFRPHRDANQAIECLDRAGVWDCESVRLDDGSLIYDIALYPGAGDHARHRAATFPAAACVAILASLEVEQR